MDYRNQRLLILGGSRISCEIVKAAQKNGIFTIVTDWYSYENSPAKQISDKYYNISTTDMEALLDLIEKENITGIITGFTDSTLPYYAEICKLSGLPCYGNKELFDLFIDKKKYKEKLREFDIPVVQDYRIDEDEISAGEYKNFSYPLLLKPSDSSGGRGVVICKNSDEFISSYRYAEKFSETKSVLIERFIKGEEATLFFLFVNGEVHLMGIGNRHIKKNQGEDIIALPVGYTFPSYITPAYQRDIFPKMKKMFKDVGIKDGMMFAQCLIEDGQCVIYDMGYRLTGSLEYKLLDSICGYNPLNMLIDYALTGDMFSNTDRDLVINPIWEKYGFNISFLIDVERTIKKIKGYEEILDRPEVIDAVLAHIEGEKIPMDKKGTLTQICMRVLGQVNNANDLYPIMDKIYNIFSVKDKNNMEILLEGLSEEDVFGKLAFND